MNEQLTPAGLYDAVVFDEQDLGLVKTPWGNERKVQIWFRLWASRRWHYIPRRYSFKLVPRSHLTRDLEALLGHAPGPDYRLRNILNLPCQIHIGIQRMGTGELKNRILGILPARPPQGDRALGYASSHQLEAMPIFEDHPNRKGGEMA